MYLSARCAETNDFSPGKGHALTLRPDGGQEKSESMFD
jgi:hypothetical protein